MEIISVDSALVYRGMDIGTAKPSAAELAAVPHHLINIRDPLQAYSAAEFVADARQLMADITARGRLPLLVGGTMLYFKALREGLDDMPRADPAIREAIASGGSAKRLARAARRAGASGPGHRRTAGPGRLATHLHGRWRCFASAGGRCRLFRPENLTHRRRPLHDPDSLLISLEPLDRAWLHQRIAQRFDAMLAAGFLDEVKALRARGDLHPDLPVHALRRLPPGLGLFGRA